MSAFTIKFSLGIGLWSGLLYGSLSIANLPGDCGHGICGPWGCGPPLQSLVACHAAWLVAVSPPLFFLATSSHVSARVRQRLGGLLLLVGAAGLLAVAIHERIVWQPAVSDWQQSFYWRRCGFVVVTLVDVPLMQAVFAGGILAWAPIWNVKRRHLLKSNLNLDWGINQESDVRPADASDRE